MSEDFFQYIDVERTIAELGYDPRELTRGSRKKVIGFCIKCKIERKTTIKNLSRSSKCMKCSVADAWTPERRQQTSKIHKGKIVSSETRNKLSIAGSGRIIPKEVIEKRTKTLKKNYTQEQRNAISTRMKGHKYGVGRKLSEEQKRQISEFHKGKKWTDESKRKLSLTATGRKHTEETKKILSKLKTGAKLSQEHKNNISKAFKGKKLPENRRGKFNHRYGKPAYHGKGAWYTCIDESKIWMRSSWEQKYAKYLDDHSVSWKYEEKIFPVRFFSEKDNIEKEGTYCPDFLVNGEWFEIKGFWRNDAKAKFEAFKEQYPNEKITLLMKPELLALGIDVK